MDVSGSMGDEQKEIVRIESFWIDTWLRSPVQGHRDRYIIHDATAREVDRDTFFHTRESGGTMISLGLQAVRQDDRRRVPARASGTSTRSTSPTATTGRSTTPRTASSCCASELLPACNLFCYGQVESPYGAASSSRTCTSTSARTTTAWSPSEIKDRDAIVDSIKTFLGKGK